MHALRVVSTPDYTYQDYIEDLRGIVWNSVAETGMTWKQLAEAAELSVLTVSKFAYGETKKPSSETVFKLEDAVGLRTARVAKSAGRQPDEVMAFRLRSKIRAKTEGKREMRRLRRRMRSMR